MSHYPTVRCSLVLVRGIGIETNIDTNENGKPPIGALRFGELTIQTCDPSTLDYLSQVAGQTADRLRAVQPGLPGYDGAEQDLRGAMGDLRRYLREEAVAPALRDLCPHHDLDEIRGRADDLVRLACNLRDGVAAVEHKREKCDQPGRLGVTVERVRGEP